MHRRALFSVVAAAALFGTTGTARALGPDGTSVWTVGAIRIALGALTLWACSPSKQLQPAMIGENRYLVFCGAFGAALYQPAFFFGVERCGVAVGTVIALGSGPMFSGLIDRALHRKNPTLRWYTGTTVTLVGVAVLAAGRADESSAVSLSLFGVMSAMAAGLGYAVYANTTSALILRGAGSTEALAAQFAIAALILVPFLIASVVSSSDIGRVWSAGGIVMLLHLGIFTAGIAYVLYGWGLRTLHASTAVSITLVEPLTAALAAFVVLGERLSVQSWFAGVAILLGLVVLSRSQQPRESQTSPAEVS
jgi:DME family drug/metabolite transporter